MDIAVAGCGAGDEALVLASAFPGARIDGFDPDDGAIARARQRAAEAGLTGRVRFEVSQDGQPPNGTRYDMVVSVRF